MRNKKWDIYPKERGDLKPQRNIIDYFKLVILKILHKWMISLYLYIHHQVGSRKNTKPEQNSDHKIIGGGTFKELLLRTGLGMYNCTMFFFQMFKETQQ